MPTTSRRQPHEQRSAAGSSRSACKQSCPVHAETRPLPLRRGRGDCPASAATQRRCRSSALLASPHRYLPLLRTQLHSRAFRVRASGHGQRPGQTPCLLENAESADHQSVGPETPVKFTRKSRPASTHLRYTILYYVFISFLSTSKSALGVGLGSAIIAWAYWPRV